MQISRKLMAVLAFAVFLLPALACGGSEQATATPTKTPIPPVTATQVPLTETPEPISQPASMAPTEAPSLHIDTATPVAVIAEPTATAIPIANTPAPIPLPTDPPIVIVSTDTPTAAEIPTSLPEETTVPDAERGLAAPIDTGSTIQIIDVNKRDEYVDIQNQGSASIDLSGWRLVSEKGNQECALGGTIQATETLRVWSQSGDGGYSCQFGTTIWNNSDSDPAVLYDPSGNEVSRY